MDDIIENFSSVEVQIKENYNSGQPVSEYFSLVYLTCMKNIIYVVSPIVGTNDSRNALQESMIKIWNAMENKVYDSNRSIIPWSGRIAQRTAIDMKRSPEGKDFDNGVPLPDGYEATETEPNPEDIVEQKEGANLILSAISGLEPIHKEVILAYVVNKMSIQRLTDVELAKEIGIRFGTYKSRLAAAKEYLASILLKMEDYQDNSIVKAFLGQKNTI